MNTPTHIVEVPDIASTHLVRRILDGYALEPWGYHGLGHWARVLVNGLLIAAETGADREVVALFALFHDARRLNDGKDPDHGPRGAQLAGELHGQYFALGDHRLALLQEACSGHTALTDAPDITVKTCFDADRLDLDRVFKRPNPSQLCTDTARRPQFIDAAVARTHNFLVKEFVEGTWGKV